MTFSEALRQVADQAPTKSRNVAWEHQVCAQLRIAASEIEALEGKLRVNQESKRSARQEEGQ